MRRSGWKQMMVEGWAFIAVAVIAFVAGVLMGDLGASPETKTVYMSSAEAEAGGMMESSGEAMGPHGGMMEAEGESQTEPSGGGAALFTSIGCGGCHTLSAAGSTGTTGPNLDESLAPDDNTEGIEEMIRKPNAEVIEGYPPNLMPQNYAQSLSKPEIHELAEYLVATTPAKPSP